VLANDRVGPVGGSSGRRGSVSVGCGRRDDAGWEVRFIEPLTLDEFELASQVSYECKEMQPAFVTVVADSIGENWAEWDASTEHAMTLHRVGGIWPVLVSRIGLSHVGKMRTLLTVLVAGVLERVGHCARAWIGIRVGQ